MKKTKIITHAGTAHADDVLSIALIMIKEGLCWDDLDVQRVGDGRARDWADADFIVDVGHDYDPRKKWFDHHQLPRDASPTCAFTLLAKHYGIDLNNIFWVRKLAMIDSKGPNAWVQEVLGRKAKNRHEFADIISEGDSFCSYLGDIASDDFRRGVELAYDWLSFKLRKANERKVMIEAAQKVLEIKDLGNGTKMAWFDTRDPAGIIQVSSDAQNKDPDVVVSAMRDDRGDGYAAYRINDDERVDFCLSKGLDGCLFAHNSGFCMKFKDDWDAFLHAVKQSIHNARY
jgi:hypothetical protein